MRTLSWTLGLLRRRPVELLVAAVSVALAMAFVASLGAFVTQSRAALTVRAAASVPVDWQVQVTPQGSPAAVGRSVRALPDVRAVEQVSFAHVNALSSRGSGGERTTGAAYVVSLPASYASTFPGELRHLLGAHTGPLLFQQTAANLAAGPGDRVTVRTGSVGHTVRVAGVVDMPAEDSFFQVVGLAPGAGVSAPPDNVLLVPPTVFGRLVGPTTVVHQLHVGFRHDTLPTDPQTAAVTVLGRANHLQAAVAGGALVGDNLGTALTAAGEDARYATLLFLLLGVPGLVLSVVVAALVVALRSERRRREIALLRIRGARDTDILRIVGGEALLTATAGAVLALPTALLANRLALAPGAHLTLGWTLAAVLGGTALAIATQAGPLLRLVVRRDLPGVAAEAARGVPSRTPWPLRAGLDGVLLAAAGVAFWLTARSGYQVVLAPEGVPTTQVNFAALAGPALAWPGLALLVWRLTALLVGRHHAGHRDSGAPELVAAALRRRRQVVARGATGLAVALGLTASTAIFTSTYQAQSRLDVALTVGSDVAVVATPGTGIGADDVRTVSGTPGVRATEPLMHRFAYVGPDLQDLYGVRAGSFARVAPLQDAFVPGTTVSAALASLGRHRDGVLLSAETLHDYQLRPGDLIRIRLQSGPQHRYRVVPFHVLGQVAEWPTAPKDSFIVANADYLARATGSSAVSTLLVASGSPGATASAVRTRLASAGSSAHVQDTSTAGVGVTSASGLASTDLAGLSRLELGFGMLLALACSGLAMLGGIVERRRALVLLAALGATARQRSRFLASEARALVVAGVGGGAVIGGVIAYLLVKVLTGIFDPAPAAPSIPLTYLVAVVAAVAGVTVLVVAGVGRLAARAGASELRDL